MNRLLPLFLLFLFPISPSLSLPPFWADNIEISLGQGLSSDVDSCSIDDRIYVVWSDNRTGNNELFFRYSENAGHTWSREEKITETPEESIQPAIACDQKNVYVVWREVSVEDNKEKTSRIYYKKWDRELWSDDLLISDEKSKNPDIASTSIFPGYVYIVWQQENNAITAYLIRSSDSGKSFSSPQSIAEGIWETKEPSIWCGARDAYVTWADNREGQWHIFFRRWGEVTIGSDIKLSPAQNCSFPAIYGSEPKIYAVWQCKRDFYFDL